jgi:hypothetical protein
MGRAPDKDSETVVFHGSRITAFGGFRDDILSFSDFVAPRWQRCDRCGVCRRYRANEKSRMLDEPFMHFGCMRRHHMVACCAL